MPASVLLLSGSLRRASTNTAALRTVARVAPPGVSATLYDGLAALAAFDPDDDTDPPPTARAARAAVRAADAVMFSTPEYAGALPGSFKNFLDWCVGDAEPGSIYGKPVCWVRMSADRGARAHESLRTVLGYVGAHIVEAACVTVRVSATMVGEDGLVTGQDAREQLRDALEALVADVRTPAG